MGKGRKPTPDKVRELSGMRDTTDHAGGSPEFELGGAAPGWLSEYAKEEWAVVAPALDRLKMLTKPGVAPLAGYCENVAIMRTAAEHISDNGILDDTGRKNPAVTTFDAASKAVRMFACEYGFTPAAAAKLVVGDGKQDELGNFLTVHGTAGKTG